ncbi:MAG: gliding motility-associated C-terminal domain-containing protein [Spirosoma sp.]|nr:gliding motility-associated C-terminal domain-containing protein [Spirosoma sp.]
MGAARKVIRNSYRLSITLRPAIGLIACFLYARPQLVTAQQCANPSGELVVNQTFGVAGNPVSIANQTTYEFEPIDCPGDGQYAVLSSLDGTCFNSTWYAVDRDHTSASTRGNMLVVNGGNKPGVFYQQAVSGLCKGTSYEVSFWVMNLLRTETCLNALIPNLSISIETSEGLVIQSLTIGQIPQTDSPTWRRCSVLFTAPTSTEDIVIKLINNQGDYGCGNDMALDDFQVRQCGECPNQPETVYIPDAFSPNNDGMNDRLAFFTQLKTSNAFRIRVFNRWGNLIFSSQNPAETWDGTFNGSPCPADTYTWIVTYQSVTQPKREISQTGRVVLVR